MTELEIERFFFDLKTRVRKRGTVTISGLLLVELFSSHAEFARQCQKFHLASTWDSDSYEAKVKSK